VRLLMVEDRRFPHLDDQRGAKGSRSRNDSRFKIHYFQIGFDRSAFATPPQGWLGLKAKESSVCSIHDEGLPELPIKSLTY
jgi:hypothetical protein